MAGLTAPGGTAADPGPRIGYPSTFGYGRRLPRQAPRRSRRSDLPIPAEGKSPRRVRSRLASPKRLFRVPDLLRRGARRGGHAGSDDHAGVGRSLPSPGGAPTDGGTQEFLPHDPVPLEAVAQTPKAKRIASTRGTNGQRYRARVEILRDILKATASEMGKTRLRRSANLNPDSFDYYLAFCIGAGLLEPAGRKFRRTDFGDATITSINRLMDSAKELGLAVQRIGAVPKKDDVPAAPSAAIVRFASMEAWTVLARRGVRNGAFQLPTVAPPTVAEPRSPPLSGGLQGSRPPVGPRTDARTAPPAAARDRGT